MPNHISSSLCTAMATKG